MENPNIDFWKIQCQSIMQIRLILISMSRPQNIILRNTMSFHCSTYLGSAVIIMVGDANTCLS